MHGKDGADADIGFNVRGAVQRVVEQQVLSFWVLLGNGDHVGAFLGDHYTEVAAVVHGPVDGILRDSIQASYQIAGDVLLAGFSKDVRQSPAVYLVGDDLGRDRQVPEQTSQVAGRLLVRALLLQDVSLDCGHRFWHGKVLQIIWASLKTLHSTTSGSLYTRF